MDKEKILSYVMNTPSNTNPNVLKGMLDEYAAEGGGDTFIIGVDHQEGEFPNVNTIFDKTWKEVTDALAGGKRVMILINTPIGAFQQIILGTGREPFTAYGIKNDGSLQYGVTLYACSEDGFLQTKECQQAEEQPSDHIPS